MAGKTIDYPSKEVGLTDWNTREIITIELKQLTHKLIIYLKNSKSWMTQRANHKVFQGSSEQPPAELLLQ